MLTEHIIKSSIFRICCFRGIFTAIVAVKKLGELLKDAGITDTFKLA